MAAEMENRMANVVYRMRNLGMLTHPSILCSGVTKRRK